MNIEILDVLNLKEEKDKKDLNQNQNTEVIIVDRGAALYGRGAVLFGNELYGSELGGRDGLGPKKYVCPNCGKIPGPDLLWKTEENIRKPYCDKCKVPVKLEENAK